MAERRGSVGLVRPGVGGGCVGDGHAPRHVLDPPVKCQTRHVPGMAGAIQFRRARRRCRGALVTLLSRRLEHRGGLARSGPAAPSSTAELAPVAIAGAREAQAQLERPAEPAAVARPAVGARQVGQHPRDDGARADRGEVAGRPRRHPGASAGEDGPAARARRAPRPPSKGRGSGRARAPTAARKCPGMPDPDQRARRSAVRPPSPAPTG